MKKPKRVWGAHVSGATEEKMKIAVLCKYPNKMSSTIHFLGKRDISTVAFNNIKEFVAGMESGAFDFMVISLSFPHPNIDRVAVVMEQMYQKPVIVFIEDFEKGASLILQNSNHRYRITGQMSGPAIEMIISRIIKESTTAPETEDPDKVTTQKGTPEEKGRFIVSSKRADGDNGIYVDKGKKIQTELLSLLNPEATTFNETQVDPNSKIKEFKAAQTDPNPKGKEFKATQAEIETKQNLPKIVPAAKAERPQPKLAEKKSDKELTVSLRQQDSSTAPSPMIVPYEPGARAAARANRRRFKKGQTLHRAHKSQADAMTLWMCANDALDTVGGEKGKAIKAVNKPEKCFLLSMETGFASGSFAFLISDCGESMDGVVETLTDELFASMEKRKLGRPGDNEFDIFEIEEGLMREEVLERARMRSARAGLLADVEIAYLDHADMMTQGEFDDTVIKEVPLLSITPDMVLDFRVHLKLPLNRRYLRYVNQNRCLSEGQTVRLTSYGIRSVFVEADQYEQYLIHSARAQLDEELKKRSMRLIKKKRSA